MNHKLKYEYRRGFQRSWGRFPTDKFLQSRLGMDWDDIYSELRQEFDYRSFVGSRFWGRRANDILGVEFNCWIGEETGTAYDYKNSPINGFFVHPFTNVLCHQELPKRKKEPQEVTKIIITPTNYLEKIDGIWYEFTYEKRTEKRERYDAFNKPYWHEYEELVCLSKEQVGSKVLKQFKIKNMTPEERLEYLDRRAKELDEEAKKWRLLYPSYQ